MNDERHWQQLSKREERRIRMGVYATGGHALASLLLGWVLQNSVSVVFSLLVAGLGFALHRRIFSAAFFLPIFGFAEIIAIASTAPDIFQTIFCLYPAFTVIYILAADSVNRWEAIRDERRRCLQ